MSRLSGGGEPVGVATYEGEANVAEKQPAGDDRLDALLARIAELSTEGETSETRDTTPLDDPPVESNTQPSAPLPPAETTVVTPVERRLDHDEPWCPEEPDSLKDAGLTESDVEQLVLKMLLGKSEASGHDLADQIHLPFRLIDPLLHNMKLDQTVAHKGAAVMNDYVYQLTDKGRERARKLSEVCTYFGSAPVTLGHYVDSVGKQSIADQHPTADDLGRAFSDLLIDTAMLRRLGPAINSGRGMFLFGAPGNGKTSIAERITAAFGKFVWIPRALLVDGEIMRLYDPSIHEPAPIEDGGGLLHQTKIDHRWIRIKRPTVVVGGELTMDALEVTLNTSTNVSEAPIQLKSNCGTLVIDDFGRQRMTTDELLNRWIVPLEKRYDFLNMASGKKIQVPFDQLIVFSTNLEPRDLVDDAFLRRIPYKIEVIDPSEEAFRELFKIMAPILKVEYDESALDYLIEKHYRPIERPFRCCQPRDLLLQIRNYCLYINEAPIMRPDYMDFAVENYFAVM